MNALSNLFIVIVVVIHIYFLILEMFLWTKPFGLKLFRQSLEKAKESSVLAANQGLYNGFLSAGLIWGLVHSDPAFSSQLKVFFLSCVIVAGVYGAISFSKRIFFAQALPAIVALVLVLLT